MENIQQNILNGIQIYPENDSNRTLPIQIQKPIEEIIYKYNNKIDTLIFNQFITNNEILLILINSMEETRLIKNNYTDEKKENLNKVIYEIVDENLPLSTEFEKIINDIINKYETKIDNLENYIKIKTNAKNEVIEEKNKYDKDEKFKKMIQDIIDDIKEDNLNKKKQTIKNNMMENIQQNILNGIQIYPESESNRKLPIQIQEPIENIINEYNNKIDTLIFNQFSINNEILLILINSMEETRLIKNTYTDKKKKI